MQLKEQRSSDRRRGRSLLVGVIVLAVGGGGLWLAHALGFLAPLYHRLGWHDMAGPSAAPATGATPDQHAGHGGMSMPGMEQPAAAESHAGHAGEGDKKSIVWTCPMHPQIRSDQPGNCPICNMTLVPLGADGAGSEPSKIPGYAKVTITPERQQLIGVRIGKVERDKLVMSIRAVGIIEADQRRLARIQTRVSGWVTKLHVDFVGQTVEKGEQLLEIYSPELFSAQNEYLIARTGQGPELNNAPRLAEISRHKLEFMGVAPEEIAELERTRQPRETLLLRAPIKGTVLNREVLEGSYVEPQTELYRLADLSVVWLQAKIYEYELPHIEIGQPVTVTLQAESDKPLEGQVTFVEPVVQEATRTVKVRVEIDNPEEFLKPGMYADLRIEHEMGEGLLIPESAVLRTGERAISFRVLPNNRFEPVEVQLGSRFEDRYEVLSGLEEGDQIVVSAGFLIDSESRLKATTSGAAGGHKHGG